MKLIDAIRNVVRPIAKSAWDFSPPEEAINESLGISGMYFYPDALRSRLKAYPIYNWQCTDEHVGLDALYLDDEAVGCTYRNARKSPYEVEWLSKELASKVREAIMSYAEHPEFNLVDPDQEIGDTYAAYYTGQAFTDEGFFEGRPVKALIWYDMTINTAPEYIREGKPYFVKVEFKDPRHNCVLVQDGDAQRLISIREFKMAMNVCPPAVGVSVLITDHDTHKGKTGKIVEHASKQDSEWLVRFDAASDDTKPGLDTEYWFYPEEFRVTAKATESNHV